MSLSVIIPVYNAEDTGTKAIESVLKQTMEKLELIIVDDSSTDKSGQICDEYLTKDARIRVIHKKRWVIFS